MNASSQHLLRNCLSGKGSLDFVHDSFTDGRRFRVLGIVDDFSREGLALVADTSLSGARVTRELDDLIKRRGKPSTVVSCLLYTSPSPRDQRGSRMPSSA